MRIGLTYDLRRDYLALGFSEEEAAEFDSEETINALTQTLGELGHEVLQIGNIYALVRELSRGRRWDLVFNICEGVYGRSREAQVPAVLEAYRIPYTFSDPLTLGLTLDKALAKQVVAAAGLATPRFFTVETQGVSLAGVRAQGLEFPLFVKPVAEGTGKGITVHSIVRTPTELEHQCRHLLAAYCQPVLVETYLSGREATVGIVGTGAGARVLGILEVKLLARADPGVYSFANKELCDSRVEYALIQEPEIAGPAGELALQAYRALGCRDAGRVDLRADHRGQWNFLEVNPLAGLHPTHSDLPILCTHAGTPYRQLLQAIIASAMERQAAQPTDRPILLERAAG